MSLEEILAGESNTMEYKRELSPKSESYIKTIIGFANTNGGRLIIGISDTLEIIGVDPQKVFQIMDVIANTISDTCTPQIIPNISFQNVKDTCIIIVEIAPGGNRPYYVKALGMEKGCFVRVAGTTGPADACKRKELQLEGTNQYFDEMLCIGYPVEEAAIHKLCKDIDLYHRKSKRMEEQEEQSSVASLCNLKLLKMQGGAVIRHECVCPSNQLLFSLCKNTMCTI